VNELTLKPPFDRLWAGKDAFVEVQGMIGQTVRHKEGRETRRCELPEGVFYRKVHTGVGWREIIKNLLLGRLPVVDASNEWQAIQRLTQLGIDTLEPVAYGNKGGNPARRLSFIVTRELGGVISTAIFTEGWKTNPPSYGLKKAMVEKIAAIARVLHQNGINHRDLYLCHFLLDIREGLEALDPAKLRFYVVDLHRAQIRRRVPERWLVKDIASLYFSALDIGLTKRDVLRFMRVYFDEPLSTILATRKRLLAKVQQKARKLYIRDFRCEPQFPIGNI
jgi:heptose I phosphotransferase